MGQHCRSSGRAGKRASRDDQVRLLQPLQRSCNARSYSEQFLESFGHIFTTIGHCSACFQHPTPNHSLLIRVAELRALDVILNRFGFAYQFRCSLMIVEFSQPVTRASVTSFRGLLKQVNAQAVSHHAGTLHV